MANDQFKDDGKTAPSTTKKAIIAFVIGTIATSVLFYFLKNKTIDIDSPELSQDSFQADPVVSSTVQATCLESAKKILQEKNCDDKESEFLKIVPQCLNIYYAVTDLDKEISDSEGDYADLSLRIARCYSDVDKSDDKAKLFLTKINEQYSWDSIMGPVSCDSKSTLDAYIESYSLKKDFRCLKKENLPELIENLKNKKFDILNSMLPNGEVAYQGYLEGDVRCPEALLNIQKHINQIIQTSFEITELKSEAAASDLYIEIVQKNSRALNLQFKLTTDQCLRFAALLAPSTEGE